MTGENWPQIMQDSMLNQFCYYVKEDYVNDHNFTITQVGVRARGEQTVAAR